MHDHPSTTRVRPAAGATPRRRGRRRSLRLLLALALLAGLVGLVPLGLPPALAAAATGAADVSPAVDPGHGFPQWYQDSTGTRLVPCLDPADTGCVVLADATFDPARPVSFPGNFPSEFFYTLVDSGRLDTKGCSGTKPGRISVRMALEGSFANGTPVAGDQMTFGRVRVILTGGLCRTSTYTLTYPYGRLTFTTDANGALARNQGTTDVGCVPVAPTACDWRVALSSPAVKNFLRWDPAVAPAAPRGYLGDATTPHRIVGASFTTPGETAPANYVRVTGPSLSKPLETDLFTVSGKLAGPLTAQPTAVDFGGQATGGRAAGKRVTVTNLAAAPVTPGRAVLSGVAAGDFSVTRDACAGVSLARDASCTVDLGFGPTVTGLRQATLTVPDGGTGKQLAVPVAGTGTAADAAARAELSPASVDFGDQRIGVRSGTRTLTVTSSGTAPLEVSSVTLDGARPDQFAVTRDTCTATPVAVGATCTLGVAFDPTLAQASDASVKLVSNDPASPVRASLHGQGYGGVAAVSPGTDPSNGFPDWYQDERGVRLTQCIDPTDPNCIVLPGGTYAGQPPLRFPDNFPDEFFYSVVDSDTITTPGCNGSAPGKAMIRMAVEGAFAQGDPVPGDQMTFGRIRINATSGLCPGTTYTFVHPYGVDQFTADADGSIKRSPGTDDVGCLAANATSPCDFSLAVKSRVLGGLLRWDPSVGPKAPAGYLGDGATLHKVVGAPYTAPGESAPANYFRIYQGDTLIASTDQFTVMGKLGGPLVADPTSADLGSVDAGQSATKTVTLANEGVDPLTVDALKVTGPQAADFAVPAGSDRCSGRRLAPRDRCTLDVTFSPGGNGDRAAVLAVDHTGLNSPLSVPLHGVGLATVGTAALSVDRATVDFTDLHVGRTSPTQPVTVSNRGGSAPLQVTGVDVAGPDASAFAVAANGCTAAVQPGETCTMEVAYAPTTTGRHQAVLSLRADGASPGSVSVALGGTGFSGSAAVAAATRAPDGFPAWYQDSNGVRLAPCLDAGDPRCVVLAGPGYDPAQPVAFPGNYPPEFFYALADSDVVSTPGCQGTKPGTAMLRLALEGTFATDSAQPDQQLTFGRIRFHATSGLCPRTTYTFTTPYGAFEATTDVDGAVARTVGVHDVGCGAAPCDFAQALASPVLDGFLRWAPGVGAAAPAGYLGDGVGLHEVVGATYTVGGTPANWFEITAPDGTSVARTKKFLVSGKLASGVSSDGAAFPDQETGTTSATATVRFTNIGSTSVAVAGAGLTGTDPTAFRVTGGTCAGSTLASDDTCTVEITFSPDGVRAYDARVRLVDGSGGVLGSAPLSGHGVVRQAPRLALSPTAVSFADQRVGTTSAARVVQVTNTGTAALTVGAVGLTGAQAADFAATKEPACDAVAPGAACTVTVRFTPSAAGNRSATLQVASNDPAGPRTVSLGGAGVESVITLRSTTLDLGKTKIGRTTTKPVTVTNGGTAPLTISAVTVDDPASFTASRGTCTTAVAPGRSCDVSVTFVARAPAGQRTSTLRFVSDARNTATAKLTVQGTAQ